MAVEKPLGEFGRITGVYLDPRETFRDLAVRPRWVVPMILSTILSFALIYCFSQRVGFDRMVRQQVEASPRVQEMPPEQRENAVRAGVRFAPVFAYGAAILGRAIATAICAGLFLMMFNVFLGGQISFLQGLAVTSYGFMIQTFAAILSIITLYLKSPEDFDLRNPLAFNLGFFLADDAVSKPVMALANSIDLFSLWTVVVLAIGFSVVGRMSLSKGLIGVGVPWVVYVLLGVARTAAFGQ